jgi:polar amino acid transport system substrate-binding protein
MKVEEKYGLILPRSTHPSELTISIMLEKKRGKMKKIALVLLVIICLAAFSGCSTPAPAESTPCPETPSDLTDLGGREVIIGVENLAPPFNMINDQGEAVGFDYDFFTELCKRANCTPVFKEVAWEGFFEAVQAGEIDLGETPITVTMDRAKMVSFSNPVMQFGMRLVVRADEEVIQDAVTLAAATDKIVGVGIGTTNEQKAWEIVGKDRTESYSDFLVAFAALSSGDVDAVILDDYGIAEFMKQYPGEFKAVGPRLTSDFLAIPMPSNNTIEVAVNVALQSMQNDGSLQAMLVKWGLAIPEE